MEQRRRPPTEKINYRVNTKSGHIYSPKITTKEKPQMPYASLSMQNRQVGDDKALVRKNNKRAKVNYMEEYRNKGRAKKKRTLFKKVSFKRENFKHLTPLIAIGLLVALSFVAVYQNAQVQSWGLSVSEANVKLTELQNQNEALKQEKAELTNLDRIERIAKNDLKMVMPTNTILFEPKEPQKETTH